MCDLNKGKKEEGSEQSVLPWKAACCTKFTGSGNIGYDHSCSQRAVVSNCIAQNKVF